MSSKLYLIIGHRFKTGLQKSDFDKKKRTGMEQSHFLFRPPLSKQSRSLLKGSDLTKMSFSRLSESIRREITNSIPSLNQFIALREPRSLAGTVFWVLQFLKSCVDKAEAARYRPIVIALRNIMFTSAHEYGDLPGLWHFTEKYQEKSRDSTARITAEGSATQRRNNEDARKRRMLNKTERAGGARIVKNT